MDQEGLGRWSSQLPAFFVFPFSDAAGVSFSFFQGSSFRAVGAALSALRVLPAAGYPNSSSWTSASSGVAPTGEGT